MPAIVDPGLAPMEIRGRRLAWGTRTFVMGILNVTPDSFSGDGLVGGDEAVPGSGEAAPLRGQHVDIVAAAVRHALRMVAEGADILDLGGESTRPGHRPVDVDEELARVIPVVQAVRARLPDVPISIDTRHVGVADAALRHGADVVNDVSAVRGDGALAEVAASWRAPYVVVHDRAEPVYADVVADVVADLEAALERAIGLGCAAGSLIVDPGIGFGKTARQNVELLRGLDALRTLGRPLLLGASRKSTIGRILDLPVDQRLEGTLALTALGVASGVDIVRVHDVEPNVRAARVADAVVRGWQDEGG